MLIFANETDKQNYWITNLVLAKYIAAANGKNQIAAIARCARNCLDDNPGEPLGSLVRELLADASSRCARIERTYEGLRRGWLQQSIKDNPNESN